MAAAKLTERDLGVLNELSSARTAFPEGWVTPMWIGGTDASHHSAALAKLVRHGLAERRERSGWTRRSYLYRITTLGQTTRDDMLKPAPSTARRTSR